MGTLVRQEDLREEWLALGLGRAEGKREGVKWHVGKRDFNGEALSKY